MIKFSSPFIPPKAPEILYRAELIKLIKAMVKDYKGVIAIYKAKQGQVSMDADTWVTTDIQEKMKQLGDKWGKRFQEYAESHSPKYVKKLLRMSNLQVKSVLKDWFSDTRLELFGQVIPNPIRQVVKASTEYNISLISSIATEYHDKVFGALMRSITGGGSLKDLTTQINKYGVKEMWRARLIAYDQTRKVYTSITLHNCQHLGIQKMMWKHSHADKKPRPLHARKWDGVSTPDNPNGLDGLIFDINHPPLIQRAEGKKQEIHGYPSELINCTCYMRAVLE